MIATPMWTTNPQSRTEAELKKFGVSLIDEREIRLGFNQCGRQWSPMLGSYGRLARRYWRCPSGCNTPS